MGHLVDEMIHVHGEVKLGRDNPEAKCWMRVDHWAIIAVAMSKLNGVTIESLVREAKAIGEKARNEVKEAAEAAIEQFKEETVGLRRGTLTGKVVYEVVGKQVAAVKKTKRGKDKVDA